VGKVGAILQVVHQQYKLK